MVTTLLIIIESGKPQCPNVASVQGRIMGCTDTPADVNGLGLVHEAKELHLKSIGHDFFPWDAY